MHPTQVMHGTKIYVTESELARQDLIGEKLFFAGLMCMATAAFLNARYKLFKPFGGFERD